MNLTKPLFAQLENGLPVSGESHSSFLSPQNRDMTIMILAIVLATLLAGLILWFLHRRNQKLLHLPPPPSPSGDKQRMFTLKHRDEPEIEYPRNPTLAEKGGLPPVKEKRNSPS